MYNAQNFRCMKKMLAVRSRADALLRIVFAYLRCRCPEGSEVMETGSMSEIRKKRDILPCRWKAFVKGKKQWHLI